VEFETIVLCGTNLCLDNFDDIARLNRLCNDYGLDSIEIGGALGVMMEAAETGSAPAEYAALNLPHFGDAKRAAEVLDEIATGGKLGCLVAMGAVETGRALNVSRVPAVKGQAMSAYDPRVVKGTGVTFATSPQGADHTAGLTLFSPGDHKDPVKALKDSRNSQLQRAGYDALGLCVFNISATGMVPNVILDMLRTNYNVEIPDGWLNEWGRKVIQIERDFNYRAGLTAADDRLPEYFSTEAAVPAGSVFDVDLKELEHFWD